MPLTSLRTSKPSVNDSSSTLSHPWKQTVSVCDQSNFFGDERVIDSRQVVPLFIFQLRHGRIPGRQSERITLFHRLLIYSDHRFDGSQFLVEKMIVILWIASSILIAFGLFVGLNQWMAIVAVSQQKKENPDRSRYSMVPLIGGLAGAIGCCLSPSSTIRALWWIPPIVDPGCVLMFSCVFGSFAYSLCRRFFTRN